MRILFIAPIPPLITGQSLASKALMEGLGAEHEIDLIDLSEDASYDGRITLKRIRAVLSILRRTLRGRPKADVVYITISETAAGNVKDLLIYLALAGMLDRVVLHLHGGSLRRLLFDPRPIFEWINRPFLRRIGAVIISGESHLPVFAGLVEAEKVHMLPNFAPDDLFRSAADVSAKFEQTTQLKLLYMSGMDPAKGYLDLARAYMLLPADIQRDVVVDFAGRFPNEAVQRSFEALIAPCPGMTYYGLVSHDEKRRLFGAAHIFCLPTTMFEGQPLSILEAYASGCVVVTTGQPGIFDIFEPEVHGAVIESGSPESIARAIADLWARRGGLGDVALKNLRYAEAEFRLATFNARVGAILQRTARKRPG